MGLGESGEASGQGRHLAPVLDEVGQVGSHRLERGRERDDLALVAPGGEVLPALGVGPHRGGAATRRGVVGYHVAQGRERCGRGLGRLGNDGQVALAHGCSWTG